MERERELELRLERYEVTAVPSAPRLQLVWSAPVDVVEPPAQDQDGVALLSAYRITRVPSRAAG